MLNQDLRIQSFFTFLTGTHTRDTSNIKYMPVDVLEIIWENYVLENFSIEEIIKFRFNKILIKNFDITQLEYVLEICCLYGNLELLKNLINKYDIILLDFLNLFDYAAENGHLEIVKWLHFNKKFVCTSNAMNKAAENGHLEVVKWLHFNRPEFGPNGIGCTKIAMDFAAIKGYLEVVKWLHFNRTEGCTKLAMDMTAIYGNLEIIKFLHFNRKEGCTILAINNAAENGHLEVVKWLHFNRPEFDCNSYKYIGNAKETIEYASDNRQFEVVEWLKKNLNYKEEIEW